MSDDLPDPLPDVTLIEVPHEPRPLILPEVPPVVTPDLFPVVNPTPPDQSGKDRVPLPPQP